MFSGNMGAFGDETDGAAGENDDTEVDVRGVNIFKDDWSDPDATGCWAPAVFGTENVNAACLSDIFSSCNRVNRSLRLTFSEVACSFLASRAATLSSSFGRNMRISPIYELKLTTYIFNVLLLAFSECSLSSTILFLALHETGFILGNMIRCR
jgi:hypothetical protein